VPRHVTRLVKRLVVDYFALSRLVVDYFASAARPGASTRRAARRRLRRVSGCFGTSRGSSLGSSSTTSTMPRVRLLGHVARHVARLIVDYFASRRLVVDYFAYVARPSASARRAARRAACRVAHHRLLRLAQARRRLLCLRRASGCLDTSRGSLRGLSRGSSSTT
jgi:hypothetical protein